MLHLKTKGDSLNNCNGTDIVSGMLTWCFILGLHHLTMELLVPFAIINWELPVYSAVNSICWITLGTIFSQLFLPIQCSLAG